MWKYKYCIIIIISSSIIIKYSHVDYVTVEYTYYYQVCLLQLVLGKCKFKYPPAPVLLSNLLFWAL
jgi:hypothetical protein